MKTSSLFAAALLAIVLPLSATARPTLERRDGVRCTKKYEGTLNVVRLGSGYGATYGSPNNTVTLANDTAHTLTIDPALVAATPMRFQFDECSTQGWNQQGREYGQVKPVPLASQIQCVTANTTVVPNFYDGDQQGGPRALYVDDCGDSNVSDLLMRQWFYANYRSTSLADQPYVELELWGKPNSTDISNRREQVYTVNNTETGINGTVAAVKLQSPVPLSLALYNVTIVS